MAGLDNLHPVFADRLRRLAAAVGGLDWTSGYRSWDQQQRLYDCWQRRAPGCAPANRPGQSNHEAIPRGHPQALAMDIGRRNRDAARARAREFGIHFPIAGEPWHCQPVEVTSGRYTGVPNFGDGGGGGGALGSRVLRRGDRGSDVAEWQRILRIGDDGIFGPATEEATKAFQRSKGLVADGVVGPATLGAARQPPPPPPPPPPGPAPVPAVVDFRIVTRAEWGAADPKQDLTPQQHPATELWIHHSVTNISGDPLADAREVQRAAFGRGFDDISYSYLVHPDATALEGRGDFIGAHTKGRNSIAKAICFMGNYSQRQPTEAQLETARYIRKWMIDTGRLTPNAPIQGHRQNPESPSECPGNLLFPRIQEIARPPQPQEEDDDMATTAYTVQIPVTREGKEDYYTVPFPPPGRPDVGVVWITFAGVGAGDPDGENPGPYPASKLEVRLYTGGGGIVKVEPALLVGRGRVSAPFTRDMRDQALGSLSVLNRGPHHVTALVEQVRR